MNHLFDNHVPANPYFEGVEFFEEGKSVELASCFYQQFTDGWRDFIEGYENARDGLVEIWL